MFSGVRKLILSADADNAILAAVFTAGQWQLQELTLEYSFTLADAALSCLLQLPQLHTLLMIKCQFLTLAGAQQLSAQAREVHRVLTVEFEAYAPWPDYTKPPIHDRASDSLWTDRRY